MIQKIFEARIVLPAVSLQQLNKGMIKKIYLHQLDLRPVVSWKNLLFQNIAQPKKIFSLWMNVQDRLPTAVRLHKLKIEVDTQCGICHNQEETREHLFVQCEFARKVWNRVLSWLQRQQYTPNSWSQHQQWMLQEIKRKSQQAILLKSTFTEVLYGIWIESGLLDLDGKKQSNFSQQNYYNKSYCLLD